MVSKKAKLIFLMPPKTASNSIKECLLDSSINFEPFKKVGHPKIHLFLSELVNLFEIKDIESYKVVQVVRNPDYRYASSYFHQMRMLPNNPKIKIKGMDIEEFSEHFLKSLEFSNNFLQTFYGDTNFILKMVSSGKSWGGSRTYLNQTQWNDLNVDIKYFKLEEISEDIKPLSDYLGIYLPQLEKINTNKSPTNYDDVLTNKVLSIIDKVYEQDFQILHY